MIRTYLVGPDSVRTDMPLAELLEASRPQDVFAWVDILDPAQDELAQVGEAMQVHERVLADLSSDQGRPRVEPYDDHIFVMFKTLNFNEGADRLDALNLNALVFKDFLVTTHCSTVLSVDEVSQKLVADPARYRLGPFRVLYSMLEKVVARYQVFVEEMEDAIDDLDDAVHERPGDPGVMREIHDWRRKVVAARRRAGPHREAATFLVSLEHPLLPSEMRVYMRDLLEAVQRVDDRLGGAREMLQSAGELYLAVAGQQANDVMKTLSVVATVVLPLNILTGLYGTNFDVLPGKDADGAFWIFIGSMAVMVTATTVWFRRKGWL